MVELENGKWIPENGTKLTIANWACGTKAPYTVIGIKSGRVLVARCKLIYNNPAYFDSLPDEIQSDVNGSMEELTWSPKYKRWSVKGSKYNSVIWGKWDYEPYTD